LRYGLINASNDELERSIDSCESWGWYCAEILAFGILAEFAIAAIHPPYDSFCERWGSSIADMLVFLGVAGEVQFGRMASRRQAELKRRSDIKIAEANERAALALKRAEELHKENLELSRKIFPRVISPEQAANIRDAIAPFAGTPFDMDCDPGAEDAFIRTLSTTLQEAGWALHGSSPHNVAVMFASLVPQPKGPVSDARLCLRLHGSSADKFQAPAAALQAALSRALGQAVGMVIDHPESNFISRDAIHVEVYKAR